MLCLNLTQLRCLNNRVPKLKSILNDDAHILVCRYCILPLFPKSYCCVSSLSQGYRAPLFCPDTAQPFWAFRAPLSCLPPPGFQLVWSSPSGPLDSPPFCQPLSFPGSRATGYLHQHPFGAARLFFHTALCLGHFWFLLLFRHLLPALSMGNA